MNKKAKELYGKQIEHYETEGIFQIAARIAKEAGMNKGARNLYKKAIKYHEEKAEFQEAAEIAEEAGLKKEIKLYENIIKLTS